MSRNPSEFLRIQLHNGFPRCVGLGPVEFVLDQEFGQSDGQFVPGFQFRANDSFAVQKRAVLRPQITDHQRVAGAVDNAVLSAHPSIVDADIRVRTASQSQGEVVEQNLLRRN